MNKRSLFLFAAISALFLLYKTNAFFSSSLLELSNALKSRWIHLETSIQQKITTHFNQAKKIEELQNRLRDLMRYKIEYEDMNDTLHQIQSDCNISIPHRSGLKYIMAISYVKLADLTSLWLDTKIPKERIYGLLKKDKVAGIAIDKKGKAMALLNGNPKCSYGVIVGDKANGVAMGSGDNRFVIVKYIPNYEPIHVGQRVKTNGLDHIFIYGLDVGVVTQIWQEGSYKVAKVRTFADFKHPRFFWLMKL